MQKCPEIKTRVKYYNLKIDNNKIIKLIYDIKQYKYIKNQSKQNIDNLKRSGIEVENIRISNSYYYYQKYAEKKYDKEKRKKIVDAALKIKLSSGKTLVDKISEYQFIKNQDKDYIKKLKKQKNKIKLIKGKDNKKFYYKMYSEKILTVEQKKKIIRQETNNNSDINGLVTRYIYITQFSGKVR